MRTQADMFQTHDDCTHNACVIKEVKEQKCNYTYDKEKSCSSGKHFIHEYTDSQKTSTQQWLMQNLRCNYGGVCKACKNGQPEVDQCKYIQDAGECALTEHVMFSASSAKMSNHC